jgi:hypothetical protein
MEPASRVRVVVSSGPKTIAPAGQAVANRKITVIGRGLKKNLVHPEVDRGHPLGPNRASLEELAAPDSVAELTRCPTGLVLVTGPTGCGKSTTLASMIDMIDQERQDRIITIEDPIEYIFKGQNCLISQREIGAHSRSFADALRACLREDPNVIFVGDAARFAADGKPLADCPAAHRCPRAKSGASSPSSCNTATRLWISAAGRV